MFNITDFNELRTIFFNKVSKTISSILSTDRCQHEVDCYLSVKCVKFAEIWGVFSWLFLQRQMSKRKPSGSLEVVGASLKHKLVQPRNPVTQSDYAIPMDSWTQLIAQTQLSTSGKANIRTANSDNRGGQSDPYFKSNNSHHAFMWGHRW